MNHHSKQIRIAVDAMGGDFAPKNVVRGMLDALQESRNRFEVILVGKEHEIRNELSLSNTDGKNFSIVHAEEIIDMHDAPTAVLKTKKILQ